MFEPGEIVYAFQKGAQVSIRYFFANGGGCLR